MAATHQYILHLDVDEFFVQVERQHDPTLLGKPMIVYQLAETTCVSYEARLLGVRKDMDPTYIARTYPSVTRVFTLSIEGKYVDSYMRAHAALLTWPSQNLVPVVPGG